MKAYEKAYLQEAAKVKDATARAAVSSDSGILVILGRLLRQVGDNNEQAIGAVAEADEDQKKAATVTFSADLAQLAPLVKEAEQTAAESELNVLEFL